MARPKTTRSKTRTATRSTPDSKVGARKTGSRQSLASNSSDGESVSSAGISRAREFVGANANLQTAGIALAGAGILALVSTQAGRNLIKTATDAVVNLVTQNFGSLSDQSDSGIETGTQSAPRQRDQARI